MYVVCEVSFCSLKAVTQGLTWVLNANISSFKQSKTLFSKHKSMFSSVLTFWVSLGDVLKKTALLKGLVKFGHLKGG